MDIQALISDQLKRKNEIKALTGPFEKPFTRAVLKERIQQLEDLLLKFEKSHNVILEFGKPDIPYIVNKSGEATINLARKHLEELRSVEKGKFLLPPSTPLPQQPTGISNASNSDDEISEENRKQTLQVKKLNYKLEHLKFALASIRSELDSTMIWTRELFEYKNKFLSEQWSTISILEEEIVTENVSGALNYDIETCRIVFNEMNEIIKEIAMKIQGNSAESSSTSTSKKRKRLPDLKVPVFSGDYSKWLNFKDVYETIIHKDNELTVVEKMEYLKTYLEGEPLRLISAYTLSADNYEDAYSILLKRYNNKRKLMTIHLDNMTKQIGKHATADNIRDLHDGIIEGLTAIKNMGIDNDSWGPIIVHLAVSCLDTESRSMFETKYNENCQDIPSLEAFLKFLEGRYKTLEIMDPIKRNIVDSFHSHGKIRGHFATERKSDTSNLNCPKCNTEHRLLMCSKFLAMSTKARYSIVKSVSLCINCLKKKHSGEPCDTKRTCKYCNKTHNTLLHFDQGDKSIKKQANVSTNFIDINNQEVMATALVMVRNVHGKPFTVRVLIDTGAQGNFVTEGLAQKLNLPRIPYSTDVTGIGKVNAHRVKHAIEFGLEPLFPSEFVVNITALVMGKELTTNTPENVITERLPKAWPGLTLADSTFRTPGPIDIILGTSLFTKIVNPELYKSDESGLIALSSKLGWLILGETKKEGDYKNIKSMICNRSIHEDITKFWELEDVNFGNIVSSEDIACEKIFESTHKRLKDGRYCVNIPFKDGVDNLPDLTSSRKVALSRFYTLEAKFKSNPNYAVGYKDFIREYIDMGHMKKADKVADENCYYMPHHAIIRPEKTTTKIRVVFDASARSNNINLNQQMLAGPRLQDDLAAIILRWRIHRFVIAADVEKMFRQILITPEHQRFQRILWREGASDPISTYELTTVTYGTTSAPYLAVKTLHQLASDEQQQFPEAAKILKHDFYVDDVLTGTETLENCKYLQKQLQQLLSKGGFNLRKWSSNSPEILESIKESDKNKELHFCESEDKTIKTLGIYWSPADDQFQFNVSPLDFKKISKTKRMLCSDISKIFDPLGWLAPISIKAKILFQKTWISGIDWNDNLPNDIFEEWIKFRIGFEDIENIKIPRWTKTSSSSLVELHGFSDASPMAYAAAIYVKSTSISGEVSTNLLMAKSKVCPVKQELSIARLELCGALLLSRLYSYVVDSLHWEEKTFTAWCDSTVTLAWINGEASRWKMFVANRVHEIQTRSKGCNWRYISTHENPADCATRGLTAAQLKHQQLWWKGPSFLKQTQENWPSLPTISMQDIPEQKNIKIMSITLGVTSETHTNTIEDIISRFSTKKKLTSTIAYCLRFINNCRRHNKLMSQVSSSSNRRSKHKELGQDIIDCSHKVITKTVRQLSNCELMQAENTIIRQVQYNYYADEIERLKKKERLTNKNGILALTPNLDEMGVLRVTGRLQNASITFDEKHPIILPQNTHFSKLIVRDAHEKCSHGLHSLTEYAVKRRFWIVKCKSLVKYVISHCVKCKRRSPKLESQMMGNLPVARVTLNNPFYYTGVDYAGPFDIKPWKGRCNKVLKSYICVFVCMTTKALHLELASDLSSEAFLAAYRRFSHRRGPIRHIYSDCGTNFVGANKILQNDLKAFQRKWETELQPLSHEGITWHFNPPANPHAGGLWESAVKSIKHLLLKHIGSSLLTYEEFYTLLVQIEGCLNARPLGVQRDLPDDQAVLTPNHFLNGTTIFSNPEPEYQGVSLATR